MWKSMKSLKHKKGFLCLPNVQCFLCLQNVQWYKNGRAAVQFRYFLNVMLRFELSRAEAVTHINVDNATFLGHLSRVVENNIFGT